MSHNLTDRELNDLVAAAVAVAEAMSPEERAAMMEAQRQSWVRGEQGLRATETKREAMSEPITLTERERAVFKEFSRRLRIAGQRFISGDGDLNLPRVIDEWAESASPPRAPGASAHPLKVGVESGPGQPIPPHVPDVADALDGWAAQYSEPENINARHLREAAAEIRRLREQVKTERRAGIEAAAKYHDDQAAEWSEHYTKNGNDPSAREYAKQHSADAAAIRALADKPAPDERLAGLAHVRRWSGEKGQYEYVPTPDPAGLQQAVDEIAKRGETKGG